MKLSSVFRYAALADKLEAQIMEGTYRAGDKLPSIRTLHVQTGLSISTVYHAFIELEKRERIESRPKSGYFVKPLLKNVLPAPKPASLHCQPQKININNIVFALIEAIGKPNVLQLGGALIDHKLLPAKEISSIIKSAPIHLIESNLATYEHYAGSYELRRQVAKRLVSLDGSITPDKIVITNGCMDAVSTCLQTITRPGDTVLVESPTFPWFLQVMEDLDLNALEIPTHPESGVDIKALERAVQKHRIQACIFIPNFNNPLGCLMPNHAKEALVEILTAKEIPIIEDDIYGELYFTPSRPLPLKSFDRKGMVLYCSSLSKCIIPGLRIGWAVPGRFLNKFKRIKLNQVISNSGLTQWAMAKFLKDGNPDRHLRKLRTHLKNQVSNTALAIAKYFPNRTKISAPQGGLTLWVQLDEDIDSLQLFKKAIAHNIAILPGIICASNNIFKNCIRISCGMPYTDEVDQGLKTLAGIIRTVKQSKSI